MEHNVEENTLEETRKDLLISDESEFFVAIGYIAEMEHTFIFIGARDKRTKKIQLLNAAGKYYDASKPVSCMYLRALFSEVPARLREEAYLFDEDAAYAITYKAYMLDERQYLSYLDEISRCTRSTHLGAYYPDVENQARIGKTKYFYGPLPVEENWIEAPINQRVKKLSIHNTCRHTAKDLLDDALQQPIPKSNISSFFLKRLPYSTKIYKGEIIDNFFIFPIPPSKDTLSNELYRILAKIYRQMESISQSYLKNENTVKKFTALKELYTSLDNRKNVGLMQLFSIIDEWDITNQNLIDAKRGFSLFKHTATRNMLQEIKHLQQQCRY